MHYDEDVILKNLLVLARTPVMHIGSGGDVKDEEAAAVETLRVSVSTVFIPFFSKMLTIMINSWYYRAR